VSYFRDLIDDYKNKNKLKKLICHFILIFVFGENLVQCLFIILFLGAG